MQVFNTFFKICKKKSVSIMWYLVVFGVVMVLMTLTGEENVNSNFEMKSLNVSVIDEDQSGLSRSLTEYLGSMHQLVDVPNEEDKIQDNLYYRYVDYFLKIPKGFGKEFENAVASGNTDALEGDLLENIKVPGSAKGQFVDRQISMYLKNIHMYLAGGSDLTQAIQKTEAAIADAPEVEVINFEGGKAGGRQYFYLCCHYLPYVIMAMIISGLAPILVEMYSREIKNRTACSSTTLSRQIAGLSAAVVVFCLAVWGIFMLLAAVLCREEFFTAHALYGILNSFVLLLYSAALTLLVSSFSPTNGVTSMVSNVVSLSMSFLCGVFVPQSMLAASVLNVSKFLPFYWYIQANDMMGGLGNVKIDLGLYWQCIGIQMLFAAAIATAAVISIRYHRQKM